MKILVTGGAGFIGANVIKVLLNKGYDVTSIDNYSTGKKENEQEGCKYYDLDLSTVKYISIFADKPDAIIHLAGLSRIQPSFERPRMTFSSNVAATVNIMEDARRNKIPVVYAGTSSVHGDVMANPYTFTKHQAEEIIKMYSLLYDVPSCITRFYNVFGPYASTEGAYCNVLGIFHRQFKEGRPLTITGDGEQRRDFIHAEDIGRAIEKCIRAMHGEVDMRFSGIELELGTGKNYSINQLAEAFGENYPTKYITETPGEMRETMCVNTDAREILDWEPKIDVLNWITGEYQCLEY